MKTRNLMLITAAAAAFLVLLILGICCGEEDFSNDDGTIDDAADNDDDDDNNDDNDNNDNDDNESGTCPHDDQVCSKEWCPKGTVFFRGTDSFRVARSGERWAFLGLPEEEIQEDIFLPQTDEWFKNFDSYYYYDVPIKDICVAQYEASVPGATATDAKVPLPHETPGAVSKKGVLPWSNSSSFTMFLSAAKRGARLPTFEELQYIAVRGNQGGDAKKYRWIYGQKPDCQMAELSWFETCQGPRFHQEGYPDIGVTGGPTGKSDYGTGIFDLLGNVSELTSSLWDRCPEDNSPNIIYFARNIFGQFNCPNRQQQDENGCFWFEDYAGHVAGEHPHPLNPFASSNIDDGFRLVFDPSPKLGGKKIENLEADIRLPLEVELSFWNPETRGLETVPFTIPDRFWE